MSYELQEKKKNNNKKQSTCFFSGLDSQDLESRRISIYNHMNDDICVGQNANKLLTLDI